MPSAHSHLPHGSPSKRRRGGGVRCSTPLLCAVLALAVLLVLAIHNSVLWYLPLTARGYLSSSLSAIQSHGGSYAAQAPAYPSQELQAAAPPVQAVPYAPSSQPVKPQQLQPKREKYIDALVCKGFCNQVMSLYDAVAHAYLLNATLILPDFYTGFDFFSAFVALSEKDLSYDPQTHLSVSMEFFFDTEFFVNQLKPLVKIVRDTPTHLRSLDPNQRQQGKAKSELPAHLRTLDPSVRLPPVSINPAHPDTIRGFSDWLQEHDILRLRCVLGSVKWSNKVRGRIAPLGLVCRALMWKLGAWLSSRSRCRSAISHHRDVALPAHIQLLACRRGTLPSYAPKNQQQRPQLAALA